MPDEIAMMPTSTPKARKILVRIFMLAMTAKALDERACNPPDCDVMICVSALKGFEQEALVQRLRGTRIDRKQLRELPDLGR